MTRKQKRMLIRILIAAVLFLAALITDHTLHPSMWIVLPIFSCLSRGRLGYSLESHSPFRSTVATSGRNSTKEEIAFRDLLTA